MREVYRDVAFDVHQLTDEKWEWIVYPKIGQGMRFAGMAPTKLEATKGARAYIDEGFDEGEAAH